MRCTPACFRFCEVKLELKFLTPRVTPDLALLWLILMDIAEPPPRNLSALMVTNVAGSVLGYPPAYSLYHRLYKQSPPYRNASDTIKLGALMTPALVASLTFTDVGACSQSPATSIIM